MPRRPAPAPRRPAAATDPCPACGKPGMARLKVCPPCWWALPADLRHRVGDADTRRHVSPRDHADAITELLTWAQHRRGTNE